MVLGIGFGFGLGIGFGRRAREERNPHKTNRRYMTHSKRTFFLIGYLYKDTDKKNTR